MLNGRMAVAVVVVLEIVHVHHEHAERLAEARGALDQDRLTRISLLTGIFKGLNILYSKKLADRWIQLPNENPMFEGETPLKYMTKGGLPAMLRVRQLLDSRRGGR